MFKKHRGVNKTTTPWSIHDYLPSVTAEVEKWWTFFVFQNVNWFHMETT